jgi:hypothetical protein
MTEWQGYTSVKFQLEHVGIELTGQLLSNIANLTKKRYRLYAAFISLPRMIRTY